MDDFFENIDAISIDGKSRSARWKNLRGHLKQLTRLADENSDRMAALESEIAQVKAVNLKLTEVIQALSDLANEEVQREISLTLNDTDFEIVVDRPSQESTVTSKEIELDAYTVPEFLEMVKGTPGIGAKKLQDISNHLEGMIHGAVQPALDFGSKNGGGND